MNVWKKIVSAVTVVVGVTCLGPAARASEVPPSTGAAVDRFVEEQLERTGVPGAAYAVVGPAGVLHARAIGVDGRGRPVSRATPFLWGSVSKPVTATLVVMLAERGDLGLDDPVTEHVPDFATADRASSARITIRQLLDHTSGLPEGLELTDHYGADRTPQTVVRQLRDLAPVAQPGAQHHYSSLNYVVLSAVVERVTGRTFGETLREHLLVPAAMTSVPTDPDAAEEALPPGHRYVAGRARPFDTQIDPATVAAGYLTGTVDDLAAFARTQLEGGPVLDDEARALLHTSLVETGPDSGYGLGWRTWRVPGTDEVMTWHGGAAPGYQAAVLLLPSRDLAVVVLQDAYGPFQESSLLDTSWGIASILSGARPVPSAADPSYVLVLAGLALVVLVLLVCVGRGALRVVTRRPRPRRSRAGALARAVLSGGLLLGTATALLRLPHLLGVERSQVVLWAPDVSWLLTTCLVLLAATAVVMTVGPRLRPVGGGRCDGNRRPRPSGPDVTDSSPGAGGPGH